MSRRRVAVVAAWAGTVVVLTAWAAVAGLTPAEVATRIVEAIQGSRWGALAFVVVYLLRPLILFSAVILTVAGGFLFGPVAGLALVLVASNGSVLVAYGLARWAGAGTLADPAAGRVARWTARLRRRSFETVIVMRLVYLPYDLVSYLAGALRISPAAFLAGTALGSAPATVALVLFGASLERFDGGVPSLERPVLIASGVLLVAGLVLARVLRRRELAAGAGA